MVKFYVTQIQLGRIVLADGAGNMALPCRTYDKKEYYLFRVEET